MTAAVSQRLAWAALTVLFAVSATFAMLHAVPGDPARALVGKHAGAEALAQARAYHGLDQPLPQQYLRYVGHVLRGDLGESYRSRRPVRALLVDHAWPTLQLILAALLLQLAVGVPLGAWMSRRARRGADRAITALSLLGLSAPPFVVGTVLVYWVGFRLGWLPINGYGEGVADRLLHLVLPTISLAIFGTAFYAQLVRAELIVVLRQDFVRTARAKGLHERAILWRHALRPSLPPLVAAIGLDLGVLLTSAVVVESIFGWPGLGREALIAVLELDIPVVLGVVVLSGAAIALFTLLADLLILALDPRGRP
jgi:peptide/nickel transport system permease protein